MSLRRVEGVEWVEGVEGVEKFNKKIFNIQYSIFNAQWKKYSIFNVNIQCRIR